MVWCVAAPFFIGSISRGRTVRQTILGGYAFGVGSTIISFIILGNYSMGKMCIRDSVCTARAIASRTQAGFSSVVAPASR